MKTLDDCFAANRAWSERMHRDDPQYFRRLVTQQRPELLWIGCSDSRVPANQIIDRAPGEVFVHRNVANQVVHTDFNCLAVLQFAVDVLKVEHVIVVGHYRCGGIRAALEDSAHGLIDNWLRHVQDIAVRHAALLGGRDDAGWRVDRLCELNVADQVLHVARTTIVEEAWRRGQKLTLHGLIYGLEDGVLRDLGIEADSGTGVRADYARAVEAIGRR